MTPDRLHPPRPERRSGNCLAGEAPLAAEYDAAQERGLRQPPPTSASPKNIHKARRVRDAEKAEPGIVMRTLQACLAAGRSHRVLRQAVAPVGEPDTGS